MTDKLRRHWPYLVFACLAVLFLWRVVFTGQSFVPAQFLRWLAPWSASYTWEQRPPWNPLMYDSVGQFYPWRKFAGEEMRAGRIPLWNPYQFCGAPFLANSQSAVLYPGNLLFCALPARTAAGWTVLLHLFLAAAFMGAFLKELKAIPAAQAFGGAAFGFCTWQVAWLHLPTFLDTSCWLPLALLLTLRAFSPGPWRVVRTAGLGFALGMSLLAGHLQIAFYVVLAAVLLAAWLAIARLRDGAPGDAGRGVVLFVAALCLAGLIAAPQVLPSLELSRRSHRTAPPSPEGYAAYTNYAVHPNALATVLVPDYYGNPSRPEAPYFGRSRSGTMLFNYAEGALYVGLPTLLLAAFALVRRGQRGRLLGWLGGLALLSLLMALGTAVDAVLYFHMPGFGQSGSPGRALVLWAFAVSALAALGMDKLLRDDTTPWRAAALAVAACAALGGIGIGLGAGLVRDIQQASETAWQPELVRQGALMLLATALLVAMALGRARRGWMVFLPVVLLAVDLFANGVNYNPTTAPSEVYAITPEIMEMRQRAGHDRVAPSNRNWSFAGPQAVLPPNGAMVYRLRDVQGYDSLFPGQYKAFMNRLEGADASPPEVGNMVFAKTVPPDLIRACGVRVVASAVPGPDGADTAAVAVVPGPQARARLEGAPGAAPLQWLADDPTHVALEVSTPAGGALVLADQVYPGWHATVDGRPATVERADDVFRRVRVAGGRHRVDFTFRPASFHVGVYLLLAALAGGAFTLCGYLAIRRAQPAPGHRDTDP